ncbi:MAG: glycosyltransferase family 4 protein [Polyangiales bacterium]
MPKILFVANQYAPNVIGGAELSVQTLVEELHGRGHQVAVASLSRDGTDSEDFVNGVRVYRVGSRNLYTPFTGPQHALVRAAFHAIDVYNPWMGHQLARILDRERPDWVSAHNIAGFSTSVWSTVKSRGIGLIQVLHDYWAVCPQTRMNKDGHNCERPCGVCSVYGAPKRYASRLPDVAIGVSKFAIEKHLENGYFPRARTGVAYNGRPYTRPTEYKPRTPGAPLRLGFIGRIEEAKGIEELLTALSRLPPDRWTLRVAGRPVDPAYLDALKERFPLPQVEYLGYVKAAELYQSIDMLVVPSRWHETLCVVVYEALGFGLPVLAARVGGIPEILEGHDCGWLFEPGNAGDLEANLRARLDGWPDPEGLWERAIQRRTFFTPERQADSYLALLEGREGSPPRVEARGKRRLAFAL